VVRLARSGGHRRVALAEIESKSRAAQAGFPPGAKPASAAPSSPAPIGASAASAPGACRSRLLRPRKKPPTSTPASPAPSPTRSRPGTNFWYDATAAEILAGRQLARRLAGARRPHLRPRHPRRLDRLRFLPRRHPPRGQGGTQWPADLYLEGSDQHRGWFQSSLWTSVIAFDAAPYKAVLTHGFIVDKAARKSPRAAPTRSRRPADAYVAQHGADVIRLWIASQDFRDDIPVDDEILKHVGEAYRLFRNSFRYQLSNLFDFDPTKDAVPVEKLDTLDRWALHQTATLIDECTKAYDAYEFHRVYQLCNQFCSVTLSAVYHDILKDRLYTLGTAHPLRRSSQTAIHHIFNALVRLSRPSSRSRADEAWAYATAG
jgi:isoleucyl-tRNA synthetase